MNKVMIFGNTMWSVWRFRSKLIEEITARGDSVVVLAPFDGYEKKFPSSVMCLDLCLSRAGVNPFAQLKAIYDIIKIFKSHNPDIIINYTIKPVIYGSIAARFAHVKRVTSFITGMGFVFIGKSFKYLPVLYLTIFCQFINLSVLILGICANPA